MCTAFATSTAEATTRTVTTSVTSPPVEALALLARQLHRHRAPLDTSYVYDCTLAQNAKF